MDNQTERNKRIREFLDWDEPAQLREDVVSLCLDLVKQDPDAAVQLMRGSPTSPSCVSLQSSSRPRDTGTPWNAPYRSSTPLKS